MEKYKEKGARFTCFNKEDSRKLQVLQNKVVRLTVPGSGYNREKKKFNMSTEELYNKSGELSVHQLGAYHTLSMTKKIILTKKTGYLARRLQPARHSFSWHLQRGVC